MASFCKTAAAVCLVALCGFQSAAGNTAYNFTIESVTDEAYTAASLARNGKLPVHISEVSQSSDLVASLTKNVQAAKGVDDDTCKSYITTELKKTFRYAFEYNAGDEANRNYLQLFQDALEAGLDVFNGTYPTDTTGWQNIWGKDAGASLAYLLGANSTEIGCVIGQCTQTPPAVDTVTASGGAQTKKAIIFCQLTPAPAENSAPFDKEYFDGLVARETSLVDMTPDDLKASGSSGVAVPTILITGLVTLLAALSA